jgi:peptidase M28-like protein
VNADSAHLARLGAVSRPSGSAALAEARQYCAGVLRQLGFSVAERPFEFSKLPGAYATPLAGVLVPLFAYALCIAPKQSRAFGVALVVAAALVAIMFRYLGGGGVLDLRAWRASGVNLEATRGETPPAVWLVAHLDSKWQPVSMIVRVLGVVLSAVGLLVLAALWMIGGRDRLDFPAFLVACAGAIPLILSYVGERNHGTLDNASGVAAVLEAAELLSQTTVGHPERSEGSGPRRTSASVGVLITDAEELALAGARAWARGREPAIAINCDSVDDVGLTTVMYSSPMPRELLDAIERGAVAEGEKTRVIRLIPGVLTDHVALASAGWTTVTLSRGSIRTLRRIHTSRDTLATMRGTGIAGVARVMATAAMELS